MEKVLLFITAASLALCRELSPFSRQYHFMNIPKNWTEAQSYCREKYSDLASVTNMEEVTILKNMANNLAYSSDAWIGLYNDLNSWRWSMSDSNFYQHEEKEFRKWATRVPNNKWGKESCGVMISTGVWEDVPCTETLEPICFNVTGTNVTFVRINTGMQWPAAQSYCREHHSDLASVRNELENHKIHQLVPAGAKVWIGLYRDTWKWEDGTNSSFRLWSDNQPNNNGNENCAVANFGNGGKWEDWSCAHKKAFICYTAFHTKQVIKLKLAFSSSVDQNKSAEDLLRKLKQKMQDSGVKGDIKLSWRKQPDGQIFIKEKNNGD